MDSRKIFNSKIWLYFGLILALELLSAFSYLSPFFHGVIFWAIILLTLFLSIKNLRWGLLIILGELFVGSQGHLFQTSIFGWELSLRIGLWLAILGIWLLSFIWNYWRTKQKIKIPFLYIFLALAFFLSLGLIRGLLNNDLMTVFLDFNAWLFFLLLLPLSEVWQREGKKFLLAVKDIFAAALAYLSAQTLFILFIFSHPSLGLESALYRWLRDSGLGEITWAGNGFYRIFFQSHIFIVLGIILTFLFLHQLYLKYEKQEKGSWLLIARVFLAQTVLLSVILISFSRSFWLALALSLLFLGLILLFRSRWKQVLLSTASFILSLILAFALMVVIVRLPLAGQGGHFGLNQIVDRANLGGDEAAISSRWSLLAPLGEAIRLHPVFGSGFGSEVSYITADPRFIEMNGTNLNTTYAFEWGWLDLWLKVGLVGLVAYGYLLVTILRKAWLGLGKNDWLNYFWLLVPLSLIIVHIFTPYLNHPLGIISIILTALALSDSK